MLALIVAGLVGLAINAPLAVMYLRRPEAVDASTTGTELPAQRTGEDKAA